MTKALKKNTRRSISGSLGRYIAILLIIMLGVAFLTGLRDTRPIMSATETAYVKNTKLYDLRLISTIGFDADDVAAVQKADGVVAAAGSVNADFIWQHDNKERVYRAHMLTDNINEPMLTAGRMPENGSECLIDSSRFSEGMIGQTIEISDSNDEDTKKNFKYSTYTVVGLADSPLYIHTLRGTTSLGDGTLQGFVLGVFAQTGLHVVDLLLDLFLHAFQEAAGFLAGLAVTQQAVHIDHADLDGGFLGLLAAADGEAEDEQGKDEETNTHGEFSLDHPQDVRFQSEWPACTMFCSGTQLFSAAPLRRTAGTGPRARRHAH